MVTEQVYDKAEFDLCFRKCAAHSQAVFLLYLNLLLLLICVYHQRLLFLHCCDLVIEPVW